MRLLRQPLSRPLLLAALTALSWAAHAREYTPQGRCGDFDRVAIQSPPGTCVALVADEAQGLRSPRRILEVTPGRYWIVDMGSWEPRRGRLLEMTLPPGTGPAGAAPRRGAITVLAEGLDRPLGLALGPDGKVYIGEAARIWRTPVPAPGQPLTRETLLDNLPATGTHPLKELAFGPKGALYVSIGSGSDGCFQSTQAPPPYPCPEVAGDKPRAAVYEAVLGGPDRTVQSFKPFATGLRNAIALAVQPDGTVLQGENGIDYSDADQPPEELNLLERGRDYGWPYCVGRQQPARGYEGRHDCKRTEAPLQLWPAHAAPLHMMIAPADSPWAGQLLVAWHGYRNTGHRVMRVPFGKDGRPARPQAVLAGWDLQAPLRPMGKPTGLAVDRKGRLLVVEDNNRTVLMVLPEPGSSDASKRPAPPSADGAKKVP